MQLGRPAIQKMDYLAPIPSAPQSALAATGGTDASRVSGAIKAVSSILSPLHRLAQTPETPLRSRCLMQPCALAAAPTTYNIVVNNRRDRANFCGRCNCGRVAGGNRRSALAGQITVDTLAVGGADKLRLTGTSTLGDITLMTTPHQMQQLP